LVLCCKTRIYAVDIAVIELFCTKGCLSPEEFAVQLLLILQSKLILGPSKSFTFLAMDMNTRHEIFFAKSGTQNLHCTSFFKEVITFIEKNGSVLKMVFTIFWVNLMPIYFSRIIFFLFFVSNGMADALISYNSDLHTSLL